MTTHTLSPAVEETSAPAASTAADEASSNNTLSVIGLIMSLVSIPFGLGALAIVGVVLGFLGHRSEPQARTMATWAIVAGLLSLFGWILVALTALTFALPFAFGAWMFGML